MILRQYPVTLSQLDHGGEIGRRQNPPDYRSEGGRVERWTVDALVRLIAADAASVIVKLNALLAGLRTTGFIAT